MICLLLLLAEVTGYDVKNEKGTGAPEDFDTTKVMRVVQFNVILYATCFWIQQSCFPVSLCVINSMSWTNHAVNIVSKLAEYETI